jgi:hypothetical protein
MGLYSNRIDRVEREIESKQRNPLRRLWRRKRVPELEMEGA